MKSKTYNHTKWCWYNFLYHIWKSFDDIIYALYRPLHYLAVDKCAHFEEAMVNECNLPPEFYKRIDVNPNDESMDDLIKRLEKDPYYRYGE